MRLRIALIISALLVGGCSQHSTSKPPAPTAYGTQIVEVSGGKQVAEVGSALPQPVVVQVNGADGNAVTGALVSFRGQGLQFNPAQALTDSSGQVTASVQLGFNAGDYQVTAETVTRTVVRIDGGSKSPHAVIESFNVLPPDQ